MLSVRPLSDPRGQKAGVCSLLQEVQQHTEGVLQGTKPVSYIFSDPQGSWLVCCLL